MHLEKVTDRIWISSYEEERDRPALGYIYGEKYCLAVDAGHSREHTEEFYNLLGQNGLPLPDLTVFTHWHWDHTFGISAVNGFSLAEKRTEKKLQEIISSWNENSEAEFKAMDPHIALEYTEQKMYIVGADIVYDEELLLDLGNIHARCFHVESPHTEDSVLILVPEEKVLFLGDSICGEYPEWIIDQDKMRSLIYELERVNFDISIGGHWEAYTKDRLLAMLRVELL